MSTSNNHSESSKVRAIPQINTEKISAFCERLRHSLQTMSAHGDSIRASLDQIRPNLVRFAEGVAQISARIAAGIERLDRDQAWLIERGWPPAACLPARLANDIRQHIGDPLSPNDLVKLEEIMVDLHTNELLQTQVLTQWQAYEFLRHRREILEQSIQAHILGLYNASIPLVLTQIEGVVVEASGQQGQVSWSQFKQEVRATFGTRKGVLSNDAFLQRIQDELLSNFFWGQAMPEGINRHAVLHGADVSYGTVANSLRTILIFDYLVLHIGLCHQNSHPTVGNDAQN